ncbi:MAG: XdhC family protein [Anaerolineae bacterium]|nr:XdhC family protein [Anaerolineae bacterium]
MDNDLTQHAAAWLDAGEAVALATIVRIRGSSAQPLGARMVMTGDQRFVGAVSGGCVETDVYEAAGDVLAGDGPLMLHYKRVENPLVEIGLNCDGQIDVLVERLDRALFDLLSAPPMRVLVTLCAPNEPLHPRPFHAHVLPDGTASAPLPEAVREDALAALEADLTQTVTYPDGRVALLEPVLPPPTLLIFGGEQIAVPLVRFARLMGFRTVVTDARPAFATREKHADADDVLALWPDEVVARVGVNRRTFVVSLNHEPRFEDAMLRALAGRPLAYLGAIGKPQRAVERAERAQAAGLNLAQLPPIHTPVGLDLGGKSAEEIALSIIAEIIAVKNRRPGGMAVANRP